MTGVHATGRCSTMNLSGPWLRGTSSMHSQAEVAAEENAEMIDSTTFADRQQRLRGAMAEACIDLVAVYADVWRPGHVFYLTNWREPAGGISQSWCLFLLPSEGESVLLVGFETTLQAPEIAVMDRVERSDRLDAVLADIRQKFHPRRVGLIGENLLPLEIG